MASQMTETVSINGWKNLLIQARTDGYLGSAIVQSATVMNFNATVAYVHATSSGSTNPATGADGLPIGTTAGTAPSASFTFPAGTDIGMVWIFTSGAQDIKYAVIGR